MSARVVFGSASQLILPLKGFSIVPLTLRKVVSKRPEICICLCNMDENGLIILVDWEQSMTTFSRISLSLHLQQ